MRALMSILISGICGFVGSSLARFLKESQPDIKIFGFDNFSRPGSHLNRQALESLGIKVFHADVRNTADMEQLPAADWLIDAAANPSVLAGVDGVSSAKQVVENNLYGTVNLLEYARKHKAGFILLSTSRVYSIAELQKIPMLTVNSSLIVDDEKNSVPHVSSEGIRESFSTAAPISIYGSTKLCSEVLALEYGDTYDLPVWINRCGVLAGAGQFGRPDQGIFAYWINAFRSKHPLRYIGFGGTGHQYRDCLHPRDLAFLVEAQMKAGNSKKERVINVGGGARNAMSLKQLSDWCQERYGAQEILSVKEDRQLDVPWVVMDSGLAESLWDFEISVKMSDILTEIADHADKNPEWLKISAV